MKMATRIITIAIFVFFSFNICVKNGQCENSWVQIGSK